MATSRTTGKPTGQSEAPAPARPRSYGTGDPAWIELCVPDTERAAEFYRRLFGWEHNRPAGEKLSFGLLEGERVAGFRPIDEGGSGRWSVYLATDHLEGSVTAAESAGATVLVPPQASASWGRFAVLTDPTNGEVGLWEAEILRGVQAQPGNGTPVWFELASIDHDAAVTFYGDALGWDCRELERSEELTYTVLGDAPDGGAGITGLQDWPDVRSRWAIYFGTPDTDASVRRVVEIGGTVVVEPRDTPYGRLAAVADDQGAVFHLMGPADD
ncbi:VOC family protein [Georgenia sp. Z1344]|uniref:VOC family protein n=1 Tax=Georgenia sp. Z1344 TaxID=3416706 RepID=UPI003CF9F652